jgi:circadian clock protein KaiB
MEDNMRAQTILDSPDACRRCAGPINRKRTLVKTNTSSRATKAFEKALATRLTGKHILRLYVAGANDRSRRAILRARQLCETELSGDFELKVIDVYQQPILARDGQIVATPTLVKEFPPPVRRLIGNLSNTTGLFVGSDLNTMGKTAH